MILQFLQENYQLLIVALVAIIEVVVFFIRKKPSMNYDDHVKSLISEFVPSFVVLAELSGAKGSEKLSFVVSELMKKIKKYRTSKDEDFWKEYIISKVEAVLSTPQKKGN